MSRIFLSHQSANNALALALAQWLEREGWDDYFLDLDEQQGIAPGERWQDALKAAADRCEVVLFLISPAWLASPWCLAEFLLAKQLGKRIFGVVVEKVASNLVPVEMRGEWQLCDLVSGEETEHFDVVKIPIVPATPVDFAVPGLRRLHVGLQRAGLDATTFPWPPAHDPARAPYPGLRAHDIDDAAVFYGRQAAIVRGLDTLRAVRERGVEQALAIVGASGSGKSSFLRAGLWPRLARDEHFLPLRVVRPERAAITGRTGLLASLDVTFQASTVARSRATIRRALEQPDGLVQLLLELAGARKTLEGTLPTVIIAVDQAEELFAAEGHAEASRLLDLLAPLIRTRSDETTISSAIRLLVVFGIRSDSIEALQTCPQVSRAKLSLFSLPPLVTSEYKAVIEGPAARHSASGQRLKVEPALTEALMRDSEGADALPLLAFMLERLYIEYGGDGELNEQDYLALGGVRGAIEAAIVEAFREPEREPAIVTDPAAREGLLRGAFIPWLAFVDPDTGQRKRRVAKWDELPAASYSLVERLVAMRLLVRDRRRLDPQGPETIVVEVAHEALLRQWPTLDSWLDIESDALRTLEGLRRAAGEWKKNQERIDWLVHSGDRLNHAELILARPDFQQSLGSDGLEYVNACKRRAAELQAERDAQRRRIEQDAREVGLQTSRLFAASAERANDKGFFDRGLRLALLASREDQLLAVDEEARAQLVRAAHHSALSAVLLGHQSLVQSAAFSADGTQVVTASGDKTARVWDAASGRELARLTGHDGTIQSVAFSADGTRVVTASDDTTARVWDATSGRELARLSGHDGGLWSAVFSTDGTRVVTASRDNTARLWDATSGRELGRLMGHDGAVQSAAFSADGTRVVTASRDSTARVWDATSGHEVARLTGHQAIVASAVFSADATRVVTASDDTTARVWDAASGRELAQLTGHEGAAVVSALFSADGTLVVTASGDRTARVWDAASGRELARLTGHDGPVQSAVFSDDGTRVVTASWDTTARVWDAVSGRELARLTGHDGPVQSAVFSADGTRVVTASKDGTARMWDATSRREVARVTGHDHIVTSAAFSIDGTRVVTACWDGTARVWEATSGRELARLTGHDHIVRSAAFSADGTRVATASEDTTARVWDATSGRELARLTGHDGPVQSAVFSADGTRVVTASWDGTARVWEASSGRELARLMGHDGSVRSAVFSAAGTRVVTASGDTTARVWDASGGRELARLTGHDDAVTSAAFSTDGTRVATASDDTTARVWDTASGREFARLMGHDGPVQSAVFSADGARVATASEDKTARVWDATSGRELARLTGHDGHVTTATFNGDGARVVTASTDSTARVWDATSGRELARLTGHNEVVTSAAFSADGGRVVTASFDKTARVWDVKWTTLLNSPWLVTEVCNQRLLGATANLTAGDLDLARILRGREGEDVCAGLRNAEQFPDTDQGS